MTSRSTPRGQGGDSTQDIEAAAGADKLKSNRLPDNVLDHIVDMREYDVP